MHRGSVASIGTTNKSSFQQEETCLAIDGGERSFVDQQKFHMPKRVPKETTSSPPVPSRTSRTQDSAEKKAKWEIRYSATEVLAVYMGDDEIGFVRLEEDVHFADPDDGEVAVEWLVQAENEVYESEEEIDSIVLGAFIRAVTGEVFEWVDGAIEVSADVMKKVRETLEQQLSDDFDPSVSREPLTHEARIAKREKLLSQGGPKRKASQKTRKSADEEDSADSAGPSTKKRKNNAAKASSGMRRTGGLLPRDDIVVADDIWSSKERRHQTFSGDTLRASKEVIRAIRARNADMLRSAIGDREHVADLFVQQSCGIPWSAVELAFAAEAKEELAILFSEKDATGSRVGLPSCSLAQQTTGKHTSRYADYNRREVGAARGGKEGNNAFTKDIVSFGAGRSYRRQPFPFATAAGAAQKLAHIFEEFDPVSVEFFQHVDQTQFEGKLVGYNFPLYTLVRNGHRELAEMAMKTLQNRGVGLNSLHIDTLSSVGKTLDKFRAVSVEKRSDANYSAAARFCPVHCAAINPDPSFLQQLLAAAPGAIHCQDSHEATVLHYAAVAEAPATLQWLLGSSGPGGVLSCDAKTRKTTATPLMWAAQAGRGGSVRVLCDGVAVEEVEQMMGLNASGLAALHLAAGTSKSGRLETVAALLDCGEKVDRRGDARLTNKTTASLIAARRGDLELLKLLADRGACLSVSDKLGHTLLMAAAMNGHLHVLSWLLRAGVDAGACDSSENRAIHYAAAYGWVECLELLLQHAQPDPRNSWGSTPLWLALKKGCFACAAALLQLTEKVDVNVSDKTGRSLFSSLVGAYLSELEADPSAPVPWAVQQILLRSDLDVSAVDSQRRSVLHYIAESAGARLPVVLGMVRELLSRGGDPLLRDKSGQVAAGLALKAGNLSLAKALLEHSSHKHVPQGATTLLHLLFAGLGSGFIVEDAEAISEASRKQRGRKEDTENDMDEDQDQDQDGMDEDEGTSTAGHQSAPKKGLAAMVVELLNLLGDQWMGAVDEKGRTPVLVAVDRLCEVGSAASLPNSSPGITAPVQRGPPAASPAPSTDGTGAWAAAKASFEALLPRMTAVASTLQPKKEFARWELLEQRIAKAQGKAEWSPCDAFASGCQTSVLHALCSLSDSEWALRMFDRVLSLLDDAGPSRHLLNLKSADGHTPVSLVLKRIALLGDKGQGSAQTSSGAAPKAKLPTPADAWVPVGRPRCRYGARCYRQNPTHFQTESHPMTMAKVKELKLFPEASSSAAAGGDSQIEQAASTLEVASTEVQLLARLQRAGAEMNGVPHPLFDSAMDAWQATDMDTGESVEGVLQGGGSAEEKVAQLHAFVEARERGRVREALGGGGALEKFGATFRPYSHALMLATPSSQVLAYALSSLGMRADSTDLAGNTALHAAVAAGRQAIAVTLLDFASSNAVNDAGDSALILACEKGLLAVVRALLARKASLDTVSPRAGTALHAAVRAQHSEVVKLLLSESDGCDVNAADKFGRTALHLAVAASATSTKQDLDPIDAQLLRAGADINAQDMFGRSPPFYAFVGVGMDMVCDFPAKVTKHDPVDSLSVLAVPGVRFDLADAEGRTVLHLAAAVNATVCVLSLAESHPAIMAAADMDGNTPLALALLAKSWDTALMLISKGSVLDSQVTRVDREREQPTDEPGSRDNGAVCVVETARSTQSTLWHALSNREALATYMLSAGRLPMDTILSGLLLTGRFQKALQQVRLCSDDSLVARKSDKDGMSALHRLAQASTFANAPGFAKALVGALLERGVELDGQCHRGWTAVHVAAFHGHVELLKELVEHRGARVDLKDSAGHSPLASMFAGPPVTRSIEMLCVLCGTAADKAAMARSSVQGQRCKTAEARITAMMDPRQTFETEPAASLAREAFERVLALKEGSKASKKSAARYGTVRKEESNRVQSTVLIEAVRGSCNKAVNSLLSFGADAAAADADGRNAVHHAVLAGNDEALRTLLRWSTNGCGAVDGAGFSPLAYAVREASRREGSAAVGLLLEFGVDPQGGRALDMAVAHNQLEVARELLRCVGVSLAPPMAPSEASATARRGRRTSALKTNDVVWVRYGGGVQASWEMSTVVRVAGERACVVPGTKPQHGEADQRGLAVEGVPCSCLCAVDAARDCPADPAEAILKSFKAGAPTAVGERAELLKRRSGVEHTLLEQLDDASPSVQAVLSALAVGDPVGRLVSGPQESKILQLGAVAAAHPCGLYDVRLLSGALLEKLKRTDLRTLRAELQVHVVTTSVEIDPRLVHTCVCPLPFGSYENVEMLRELAAAGAKLDATDSAGRTPLDLARPGSEIQALLRTETKSPSGGRQGGSSGSGAVSLPPLDGIDLEADANAALRAMHEQGADAVERVVPAVNPVCELDSDGVCVVEEEGTGDFYDVALTNVDVEHGQFGKYVFYRMQLLLDPVQQVYVLLTNWGRIGESGKFQQTPFSARDSAVKEFVKVFKSKTANAWAARAAFEKKPGKYSLVKTLRTRVKHPEQLLASAVERPSLECSLNDRLAETLRSLLSSDTLCKGVRRCGLDQTRLPLGQLSIETLDAAEAKLTEVRELLETLCGKSAAELRTGLEQVARLTSEFYELLPAADQVVKPFSRKDKRLGEAAELVRLLRDLSVTKQLLLGGVHCQSRLNPVDYAYRALQVGMAPLAADSTERMCLQRYIDATCGRNTTMLVNNIYALHSDRVLSPDVGNRRLLFHGSPSLNVLGILKQGLRIAPPEAPTTGFMYGKGVYFSDSFAKALGYTTGVGDARPNTQPRAFVFVAEVALGQPYVAFGAEYMENAKDGSNSTHAPGASAPDPALDVTLDESGVTVPLGEARSLQRPASAASEWSGPGFGAQELSKLEAARLDPGTQFPATVRLRKVNEQEYDVKLESMFASSATAVPVEAQQPAGTSGAPDMRAFQSRARARETTLQRREKRLPGKPHSEFVVYDPSQIRLRYLVELTGAEWVRAEFRRERAAHNQ